MKKFIKALLAFLAIGLLVYTFWFVAKPLIRDTFGIGTTSGETENTGSPGTLPPLDPPETSVPLPTVEIDLPPVPAEGAECSTVTLILHLENGESGAYDTYPVRRFLAEKNSTLTLNALDTPSHIPDEEKNAASFTVDIRADVQEIHVYYVCRRFTVTFDPGEGEIPAEEAVQRVICGQMPRIPQPQRNGYTWVGYDTPVTAALADVCYVARYKPTVYQLNLYLPSSATIGEEAYLRYSAAGYTRSFTVESAFVLPQPEYEEPFLYWCTTPDGEGERITDLTLGTVGDRHYFACFTNCFTKKINTISFAGEGIPALAPLYAAVGDPIDEPLLSSTDYRPGYGLAYFTDPSFREPYTFDRMPESPLTLYVRWEKEAGTGFLSWDMNQKTLDSYEDLLAFTDYMRFFEPQGRMVLGVTYADLSALSADLSTISGGTQFHSCATVSFSAREAEDDPAIRCYLSAEITVPFRDKEVTKHQPAPDTKTYSLAGYTLSGAPHAHAIDRISQTYPVTTTNQLHYVVEHGYRPLPVSGSPAERVYRLAQAVLDGIIDPAMTSYEKALAIYEYLVLNVQYDSGILTNPEAMANDGWGYYDAFYLEGVFIHKKAVCDGIAKAFSLLCNMEGIPCVEVSGNGHAWCKVKVAGRWSIADPTFGNTHFNGQNFSAMDHSYFLQTEGEKNAAGYSSDSYSHITADASFDYYTRKTFLLRGVTMDFAVDVVESDRGFADLLEHLLRTEKDLDGMSADVRLTLNGSFQTHLAAAEILLRSRGLKFAYTVSQAKGFDKGVVILMFHR